MSTPAEPGCYPGGDKVLPIGFGHLRALIAAALAGIRRPGSARRQPLRPSTGSRPITSPIPTRGRNGLKTDPAHMGSLAIARRTLSQTLQEIIRSPAAAAGEYRKWYRASPSTVFSRSFAGGRPLASLLICDYMVATVRAYGA